MGEDADSASLRRILRELGAPDLVDTLEQRLSPADLTTFLMALAAHRVTGTDPPEILRRHSA